LVLPFSACCSNFSAFAFFASASFARFSMKVPTSLVKPLAISNLASISCLLKIGLSLLVVSVSVLTSGLMLLMPDIPDLVVLLASSLALTADGTGALNPFLLGRLLPGTLLPVAALPC